MNYPFAILFHTSIELAFISDQEYRIAKQQGTLQQTRSGAPHAESSIDGHRDHCSWPQQRAQASLGRAGLLPLGTRLVDASSRSQPEAAQGERSTVPPWAVLTSDLSVAPELEVGSMAGLAAGRRRGLPGPERCEPGPTGAFVRTCSAGADRWSCGVTLFWAASLFSIIIAPRRACAIRVPLRPAASEGEGTGPVEPA
jgi:hypothetical protein